MRTTLGLVLSLAACTAQARFLPVSTTDDFVQLPPAQYISQRQDHFNGANPNRWNQAYYVNDTFWDGQPNSPVFLCVGGEGPPLDGSAVVSSPHCNIAVEWLSERKALMFALEHRYYGCHNMSACPVNVFEAVESLQFLSSSQALADIANFHAHITQLYNLKPTNKWVTWGGSYPGILAGWARLKFPHLFHASVSSSAPVKAQVDMVVYNDIVTAAFNNTLVGGSAGCVDAIIAGHQKIGAMMNGTDDDRSKLAAIFNVSDPTLFKNYLIQAQFAGNGVAEFPAQENDPSCPQACCNIQKICAVMTNEQLGDPVQRLAEVRAQQSSGPARRPAMSTRASQRRRLARLQPGAQLSVNDDLPDFWGYQTCTEFGFYQTCEKGTNCMFTQGLLTLDLEIADCIGVFNISAQTVADNVANTNIINGGLTPVGSRVMWVNGDVDPWSGLAVLTSDSAVDQPTLMVAGASHHFWTHQSLPTDAPQIVAARAQIRQQVSDWLAQE